MLLTDTVYRLTANMISPGGIFDLSMSMATMLMSITQQGCSRMSVSFFTKATAEMHYRGRETKMIISSS